jgi:hypothetical protein
LLGRTNRLGQNAVIQQQEIGMTDVTPPALPAAAKTKLSQHPRKGGIFLNCLDIRFGWSKLRVIISIDGAALIRARGF